MIPIILFYFTEYVEYWVLSAFVHRERNMVKPSDSAAKVLMLK